MTELAYNGEKYTKPYPVRNATLALNSHSLSLWDGQTRYSINWNENIAILGEYNGDYLIQCSTGVFLVNKNMVTGGVLNLAIHMLFASFLIKERWREAWN